MRNHFSLSNFLLALVLLLGLLLTITSLAQVPEASAGVNAQLSLTPTPFFRFPVVPNAEVSSKFDHYGDYDYVQDGYITFHDGQQSTPGNGFWFACPELGSSDWVGCEIAASSEATCPDDEELWYDAHYGIDFEYAANWRTGSECNLSQFAGITRPVYAPAAGKVQIIQLDNTYNGNAIFILHDLDGDGSYDDDKIRSAYLHFADNSIAVNVGDIVSEGQYLGLGGMTGKAWTPHLHFEVQRSNDPTFLTSKWPVDPYGWSGSGSDPWDYDNYPLWRYEVELPIMLKGFGDTYEPNDSFSAAYKIASDNWYYSYIWSESDQDWFQFNVFVPANQARYIEVWLESIPTGEDYDLALYRPNNSQLGFSYNSGNADEYIKKHVTQGGWYRARVTGYQDSSSQTDSYRLRVVVSEAPVIRAPYP